MSMNKLFILYIALPALLFPVSGAARVQTLTLDDAIAMARVQSVDAAVALDELRTAYWQWRSYRAERLPEISMS